MRGRGDGVGGVAKGHTKKRDLDDELRVGLGAANPDAKRRHTAAGQGERDDDAASNSSSFRSSGQDIKKYGKSKSLKKSELQALLSSPRPSSSLPALQTQHSLNPPNRTGSAARGSGGSGAPGSSLGAKPGLPGGVFSGMYRPTWKPNSLPNGLPASSSISSDASSIPAGSTENLPTIATKHATEKPFYSLRYGNKSADRPAVGKDRPHNHDGSGQGAKSYNTEHVAAGPQRRPPAARDSILPLSRVKETKRHPYVSSSSDDSSYVEEDDEDTDDDDDESDISIPTTRQGSARLGARSSGDSVLEGGLDGDLSGERKAKRPSYKKTPSGKSYHEFSNGNSPARYSQFALFPDGYRVQQVSGLERSKLPCPVRTCSKQFKKLKNLDGHFKKAHRRSEFNDNLDDDGTLEFLGRRRDNVPGRTSLVVSQKPRHSPVLTDDPRTFDQTTKKHNPVGAAVIGTATAESIDSNGLKAFTLNGASKESPGMRLDGSSSLWDDEQDSTSTDPSDLDRIMAESDVWAYVGPLAPETWTASIKDGVETTAFIQAISLPLRNKMDTEWLTGIKNSHQRAYRGLMSVIFQVIGVEAHCKPCESRILEKRRNCKVLPPEAAGLRELQEVYGSQCVNCYFFQASKPCEFSASPATIKQTPVPVPTPPGMRPMPNVERSFDPPSAAQPPPTAATSRPQAPTYSFYKATKGEKPISQSPVPIPSFVTRAPNHQGRSSNISDVPSEKPHTEPVRRSRRIIMPDVQSAGRNSDGESDNNDETVPYSTASAASNTGLSEAALNPDGLMSGGQSTKESTAATSNLPSSETSNPQLIARAFSLFGDISQLPVEEQAPLWNQMQQMAGILQTGAVTRTSTTKSTSPSLPPGPSAVAEAWEIAPGRLTVADRHLMFSTSFLSRDIVSLKAAQQLSPTQRVLNKSIAALNQLSVGQEEGWDCTCSVIRGVLKVKIGDVEARIGQGGLIVVEKECIITNVSHKEARLQMWWRKADD